MKPTPAHNLLSKLGAQPRQRVIRIRVNSKKCPTGRTEPVRIRGGNVFPQIENLCDTRFVVDRSSSRDFW